MSLLLQLLAATAMIVVVTLIHGTGVAMMSRLFRYEERSLRRKRLAVRELTLMVPMALSLFGLHALEILAFALFYIGASDVGSLATALHVSALAYVTLGAAENAVPGWPLVLALEGLAGFLMIGWSAAVFVTDMEKVLGRDLD